MLKFGIGHSEDVDERDAAREVLARCARDQDGLTPKVGILHASVEHRHGTPVDEILAEWPELELVGCTTGDGVTTRLALCHP